MNRGVRQAAAAWTIHQQMRTHHAHARIDEAYLLQLVGVELPQPVL